MNISINIFAILSLIAAIGYVKKIRGENKKDSPFTNWEKISVITTIICNPIIVPAIYYYSFRKNFPIKAKQTNKYSFIIFGVFLLIIIIAIITSQNS